MAKTYRPPPNWPPPPPGWHPPPGWQPDPAWGPPPSGWELWARANPHPWLYTFLGWLPAFLIGSIVAGVTHTGPDPTETGSYRAGRVLGLGWIVLVVVALLARSSDRVWPWWLFLVGSSTGVLVAVAYVLTSG